MWHIREQIQHAAEAILYKHLGTGSYGGTKLSVAEIRRTSEVLSVELLPIILGSLTRAIDEVAHNLAVPAIFQVSKEVAEQINSGSSGDGATSGSD